MKKLQILFCSLMANAIFGYIPTTGPLCLGDAFDASGAVTHRGEIIKTMQNNMSLYGCLQDLCKFMDVSSLDELPAYQVIMEKLSTMSHSTVESEAAIQALEYAIMYAYDQRIYILGGYTRYLSIFFSGLRWRALNPFSYLNPFSWFTENHEKGSQLLSEFEHLTDLAGRIDSKHYARLRTTLFSYQHWFKIRLLPLAVMGVFIIQNNAGLQSINYGGGF